MDSAQVSILKEPDKVGLRRLLQSHDCGALEAEVRLEILSDFAHEPLEGQLANEQLGGLLEFADFTKGNGSRPVAMRLLDTAGGWGGLASSLGGKLLAGGFATGGLASGLLGTSHWCWMWGLEWWGVERWERLESKVWLREFGRAVVEGRQW